VPGEAGRGGVAASLSVFGFHTSGFELAHFWRNVAWIESHQSLGTHRKLMDLAHRLHIDEVRAVGLLHYLWWWSLDNAPGGDITCIPATIIAKASHWKKDPQVYVTALCDTHWVDNEDGLYLHDWDKYAGKLIQARVHNREKQQAYRERDRHVVVTSPSRTRSTVPNSTQPNRTKKIDKEIKQQGQPVGEGVTMTVEQMKLLRERFGEEGARQRIEKLSLYKLSTGKQYKSDYHTILNWERMNRGGAHGNRLDADHHGNPRPLVPRAQYTRPEAMRHGATEDGDGRGTGTAPAVAPGEQP
jgi:hypothetical protein